MTKKIRLDKMVSLARIYRGQGKKIVFTNGCFDILHAGHVVFLQTAARFGDVLVIGLNSDKSVKIIKGEKRPIMNEDHRACILSALSIVDHLILFDEPDPEKLIQAIFPHVLVKGEDWSEDRIVGGDFVKQHGGRVERIAFESNISTTGIIERIGKLYYDYG